MTAQLEVDLTSGVPAFEQIRAQVVAHVAAGGSWRATGCRRSARWPPTWDSPRAPSRARSAS